MNGRRPASAPARVDGPLALRVFVGNADLLREVYGTELVEGAFLVLADRLGELLIERGLPVHVAIDADGLRAGIPPSTTSEILSSVIDAALMALGSHPIVVGGTAVLAAISVSVETRRSLPAAPGHPAARPDPRSREDMRIATATFSAIADGRLYFLFQSIAGAANPTDTLYQECFARIVDAATDAELQTPRGFMPSLERLGLTRGFDRAVAEGAIAYLIDNPTARVGCNISALSAVDDAWWAPLFRRLAAASDLAQRLVIEITETAPRGDIDPILGFIRAVRRVGCRIAIDNFGAGFSGLRFAVAAAPEIIKIDSCYVREQAADAFGSTYLGHLVGLARCLARDVVVVGIENESDLDRARVAAANWVQGRYVAPAALSRIGAARLVAPMTQIPASQHRRRAELLSHRPGFGGLSPAAFADS